MAFMKLFTSIAVLSAFVSRSSAEDTVSLFLPGFPSSLKATSVVASIISGDSQVRTYAVACPSNDDYCSLPTPFTLVQGANTLDYTVTKSDTMCRMSCTFEPSVAGHCHAEVTAPSSRGTLDNDVGGGISYAIASITAGQSFLSQTLVPDPLASQPSDSTVTWPYPNASGVPNLSSMSDMWGWDPSATSREMLFSFPPANAVSTSSSSTASSVSSTVSAAGSGNAAQSSPTTASGQSTSSSRAAAALEVVDLTGLGGAVVAAAAVLVAAL